MERWNDLRAADNPPSPSSAPLRASAILQTSWNLLRRLSGLPLQALAQAGTWNGSQDCGPRLI